MLGKMRAGGEGVTEDEVVGQHHGLSGHEFKQAPGGVRDRKAQHAAVHRVAKTRTQLSHRTTIL